MIQFTVYNETTGAIIRTGTAMSEASARLQGSKPGTKVVLVGSDPVAQVVKPSATPGVEPTIIPRPTIAVSGTTIKASKTTMTANGVDKVTISPIPNGASYSIEVPKDQGIAAIPPGTITDGSLVITTTVAGLYTITIKNGTSLDFTVNINAT